MYDIHGDMHNTSRCSACVYVYTHMQTNPHHITISKQAPSPFSLHNFASMHVMSFPLCLYYKQRQQSKANKANTNNKKRKTKQAKQSKQSKASTASNAKQAKQAKQAKPAKQSKQSKTSNAKQRKAKQAWLKQKNKLQVW